jgi:hypothetical protein
MEDRITPEDIAQWVINNRYPKSEFDKVSDFQMFHHVAHLIKEYTYQQLDNQKQVN